MPTSLNALLMAWGISLILVLGGVIVTELSYDAALHSDKASETDVGGDMVPSPDKGPEATQASPPGKPETADQSASTTTQSSPVPAPGETSETITDRYSKVADTSIEAEPEAASNIINSSKNNADTSALPKSAKVIPVNAVPDLLEDSAQGPLPKIGENGSRPMSVYAGPHPDDDTIPRIAIVMSDLGQSSRRTKRAVGDLPKAITFAFSPYGSQLNDWAQQSRELGHEVMLMIPMEPLNYPQNDPGPLTLLAEYSMRQNTNMLRSSLSRMTGYTGVVNHMGSRFTAAGDSIRPVLEELKSRGLMFLDSRSTRYSQAGRIAQELGLPVAINNRYIDNDVNATEIANQLAELEKRANVQGAALGMARPYPVTIDNLKLWAAGLGERGFILVPASAIANRQVIR